MQSFNSGDEARHRELLHQLMSQRQGDVSAVAVRLRNAIGSWDRITAGAQKSLLDGERRMLEGGAHDYAPEIICFAKAIEITLKELLFDSFKQRTSMDPQIRIYVEIGFQDRFRQAHTFVRFVDRSNYIEMGAMVHTLRLCRGRTGAELPLLARFQDFVVDELGMPTLFESAFVEDADRLARLRNRAAHEASFTRGAAEEARDLAIGLLSRLEVRN